MKTWLIIRVRNVNIRLHLQVGKMNRILDCALQIRALSGDIVLCSWARHLTLTVPLSTQEYKWVPANCWRNLTNCGGNDLRWTSIPSRY